MKRLQCFLCGMIFYIVGIPILEQLSTLVCAYLEVLKGKANKDVTVINNEIFELQGETEPISTNCIGFEAPVDYSDDEYYEEEDRVKSKIGF